MKVERWEITDRAEWLQRRRKNVNASEIAALFGCNPYMTNMALYAEKAGLAKLEAPDSGVLRRGRILEPAVAAAVLEERPEWKLSKAKDYVWSPKWRLGATPDYNAHCPQRGVGVVQMKSVAKPIFDEDWQSGPPQWIMLQTLQEMMLEDVEWGAIAALIMDRFTVDIRIWEFARHAMAEKRMIQHAALFWEDVANGNRPAFDYRLDADVIKALFPNANETVIDLTFDNRMPQLLEQYEYLGTVGSRADKRRKAVVAEIAAKMGEAGAARVPGWESVTYKTQTRDGYTVAPTSFRQLRVKRAKPAEKAA